MDTNEMKTKKSRFDETVIGKALLVMLVLFVGLTPLSISATPGLPLWEQIWVAFATASITTLTGLLMLGLICEGARRVRSFSETCLRAVRGDRERRENAAGDALPTTG